MLIFGVMAAVAFLKAKATGKGGRADVYELRKALFTAAERSFLGVLDSVVPPDVRVFGKVRIEDVLSVKKGLDPKTRQAARNRIAQKHVDFLLVKSEDLSPLLVVELDDRSHDAEDRKARDVFVDEAMRGAGLLVVRFAAQSTYLPAAVKSKIAEALSPVAGRAER